MRAPCRQTHLKVQTTRDINCDEMAEAYLMTNQMEFFAVTASVFLYGKDSIEPFTRSKLKENQPDYFQYLVSLFEVDPDRAPSASPVASAY